MQVFNAQIRGTNAQAYLLDVIGSESGKKKFVTSLVSVVAGNQELQKCEPMSIIYAALKSVPLGLPIEANLGYAAVVPYGINASFQIMRNGWVDLLMRTGQVKFVANEIVHEGELVKGNKFTGEYVFDENAKTSDKVIGYMAYVKLINGFEKTVYWTKEQVKEHALRYSQTFKKGKGLWVDNFDSMALKTVLKHLIVKYCPKSAELQQAIQFDQSVTDKNNVSKYTDNPVPEYQPQPEEKTVDEKKAEMRKRKADGSVQAGKAMDDNPPQDGSIFAGGEEEDLP